MASTSLKKSIYSLLPRALYITVEPMPRTLSERRAVLEALQQHSSISFFKRLHDPSSFVSITGNRVSAQKLINTSPLEFSIARSPSNRLAALPILTDSSDEPVPPDQQSGADEKATFTVKVFPAHQRGLWSLLESPHAGPWPKVHGPFHRDSAPKAALQAVIPDDMAASGLADWEMSSVQPVGGNASFVRQRQLRQARKRAPRAETPQEIYASAPKTPLIN